MNTRLEIARGLAALWVFAFHIRPMLQATSGWLGSLAKYGHLGVPMFFVISGYAMYASASSSSASAEKRSAFLWRRLRRIYPPFWAAVALAVAAPFMVEAVSALKSGSFVLPEMRWLSLGWNEWLQTLTLSRVFFNDHGDLQAAFSPVNAVFWTLAIEVQFYLVMALALMYIKRWRIALLLVSLLSIATLGVPAISESGLFLSFWPSFMLGLALRHSQEEGLTPATLFGAHHRLIAAACLAVLAVAFLLAISVDSLDAWLTFGGVLASPFLPFALVAALVFWLLMAGREGDGANPPWLQPFLWLGACSYSLYLVHGRLYTFTEMFVRQVVSPGNIVYPLLVMLSTAVLAYGFYLVFERPFMSTSYRERIGGNAQPSADATSRT